MHHNIKEYELGSSKFFFDSRQTTEDKYDEMPPRRQTTMSAFARTGAAAPALDAGAAPTPTEGVLAAAEAALRHVANGPPAGAADPDQHPPAANRYQIPASPAPAQVPALQHPSGPAGAAAPPPDMMYQILHAFANFMQSHAPPGGAGVGTSCCGHGRVYTVGWAVVGCRAACPQAVQ